MARHSTKSGSTKSTSTFRTASTARTNIMQSYCKVPQCGKRVAYEKGTDHYSPYWCRHHVCGCGPTRCDKQSRIDEPFCEDHSFCAAAGCQVRPTSLKGEKLPWYCSAHVCQHKSRTGVSCDKESGHGGDTSSRYCGAHRCAECSSGVSARGLCAKHLQCCVEGCSQARDLDTRSNTVLEFCQDHHYCRAKSGCYNVVTAQEWYCALHHCGVEGCMTERYVRESCDNQWCKDHTCTTYKCLGRVADVGNDYSRHCAAHACISASCTNQVINTLLCPEHQCEKPGCASEKRSKQLFCDRHECRATSCNHSSRNDDGYCSRHACAEESCKLPPGDSQYPELCSEHGRFQANQDAMAQGVELGRQKRSAEIEKMRAEEQEAAEQKAHEQKQLEARRRREKRERRLREEEERRERQMQRLEEEARLQAEEDRAKEAKRQAEEEYNRILQEGERRGRDHAREEARQRQREEERERQIEEERERQREAEERKRQREEQLQRQREEELKRQYEQEFKRQYEEERERQLDEERKRQREEELKRQREEELKRQYEEEFKRQREEEREDDRARRYRDALGQSRSGADRRGPLPYRSARSAWPTREDRPQGQDQGQNQTPLFRHVPQRAPLSRRDSYQDRSEGRSSTGGDHYDGRRRQ